MVNFRRLSGKAKDLVEKRGGSESLKQDAEQLREIAKGPGSLSEKAKLAAAAIKEPGGTEASGAGTGSEPATPAERARAESKVAGEERGKHAHADAAEGVSGGSGGAKQGAVQSEPQGGGDKPAV